MKRKYNEGFTLIETLVAIAVLGVVIVPVCSCLILSFRMNAKTEQLMQSQLAVSSAVETLMAEGISETSSDYGWVGELDRFPDVTIKTVRPQDGEGLDEPYYEVTVSSDDGEVEVTTRIRAAEGGGT